MDRDRLSGVQPPAGESAAAAATGFEDHLLYQPPGMGVESRTDSQDGENDRSHDLHFPVREATLRGIRPEDGVCRSPDGGHPDGDTL